MALNTKRLDRSKQSTSRGGGNFLKLEEGKNYLRLFSFSHTVDKSDFTRGLYRPNDGINVGDTYDELEREVFVHFTENGAENCVGKGCEKCKESTELLNSSSKADKKLGQELKASKRFYVNCVNMNDLTAGMQICPIPTSAYGDILTYVTDPEFGEAILGLKGRDFVITKDSVAGKNDPSKYYSVLLRDREKSVKLGSDVVDGVVDLFTLSMLEAGWSKNNSNAGVTSTPKPASKKPPVDEDEEEPVQRPSSRSPSQKSSKPSSPREDVVDDDENPFSDNGEGEDDKKNLPWEGKGRGNKPLALKQDEEIPDFVEVDSVVEFDGDDGVESGTVLEINVDEKTCEVETKSAVWTLKYSEMRKPKPVGKPKRTK